MMALLQQNRLTNNKDKDDDVSRIQLQLLQQWLPESHHGLLELALEWRKANKAACCLSLLSILLEHGLRLHWCRVNDVAQDVMARPGAYYVTLDGHGQRHRHKLLLDPSPDNRLVSVLSGTTVALCTDLFVASSKQGPNLRAALAHGLYDSQIECELLDTGPTTTDTTNPCNNMNTTCNGDDDHDALDCDSCGGCLTRNVVDLVLLAMTGAAVAATDTRDAPAMRATTTTSPTREVVLQQCQHSSFVYRPVYSYRAVALQNVKGALRQLDRLQQLLLVPSLTAVSTRIMYSTDAVAVLRNALGNSTVFHNVSSKVVSMLEIATDDGDEEWTAPHVFQEHKLNMILAKCGATCQLFKDVATAIAVRREYGTVLPERQQVEFAFTIYKFATLVGLLSFHHFVLQLSLQDTKSTTTTTTSSDDDDETLQMLKKAVERSRMLVSTVSTFLPKCPQRSLQAVDHYIKSKAIKSIIRTVGEST